MRRCLRVAMRVVLAVAAGIGASNVARADEISEAAALWSQLRGAEPDSADFKAAQWKLTALVGTMPKEKRLEAAIAMMDRQARPGINEAALEMFGADPFDVASIQRILGDPQRSFNERELLKTYYTNCRPETKETLLSEDARRALVAALARRLDKLAGSPMHYGEQRLFVHLVSAVLCRYPGTAKVAEADALITALEKYAEKADRSDTFAAAIPTWLDLRKNPVKEIKTLAEATRVLGHWDPLERLKAAAWLGEQVPTDPQTGQIVLSMLDDLRDETRAEAARVFGFAREYKPAVIVPKLYLLLTQDVSTVVQTGAAESLIARADQAGGQIGPLLGVLTSPARRLGANRTSSILMVLSRLVPDATTDQKTSMVEVATLRLRSSPDGALALLAALGTDAAAAVPAIKEFRSAADRFQKAFIDRHVLPAIQPAAAR